MSRSKQKPDTFRKIKKVPSDRRKQNGTTVEVFEVKGLPITSKIINHLFC